MSINLRRPRAIRGHLKCVVLYHTLSIATLLIIKLSNLIYVVEMKFYQTVGGCYFETIF